MYVTLTLPRQNIDGGKRNPISPPPPRSVTHTADMPNLSIFLLFLLLSIRNTVAQSDEEKNFFRECPAKRCSNGGPWVRYPLRLKSTPLLCGARGLELSCSDNQTILTLPSAAFIVTDIDYSWGILTTRYLTPQHPCPLGNLSNKNVSFFYGGTTGFYTSFYYISLLKCSERFIPKDENYYVAPISCLSGADVFVYAADGDMSMDILPRDCSVVNTGFGIPGAYPFKRAVDTFSEGTVEWGWANIQEEPCQCQCRDCEKKGRHCWFSLEGNQTRCASQPSPARHGPGALLIAGTSIGGLFLVIIVLLSFIFFYISRRFYKGKEAHLKVEKFLAMYKNTNPTRYSFSDIKKITKRFSHKLGQGGFGSVYKGELPNGIPVAVKTLEKSRGEGEGFTNEVATIGRIHHVNIVRLLGFCSEEMRYALVYEFMPNESLEKFIFSEEAVSNYSPLNMEILQKIALGVANGIEYLHQGCNQRILHFDIKPHNILLDHDFNPKISDFGLAKLCSKDYSIVTMTAARGTMGYIAPEIYSRNFGTVSYKSDVYSFGMLVMEMVGGRRNIDPTIENQGEIYFPEWVYNRLINGQDLGLVGNMNMHEEEIAKKLAIVALWCIQWSPGDRPSMTKVIEMLIGDFLSLQMPPKPFFSSSDQDYNAA